MLEVRVLMASGDEDTWEDAVDAVDDRGSLVVLYDIEGDEVPDGVKTLDVGEQLEVDGQVVGRKGKTYRVAAQYAPGMWMRVEFE